MQIFPPGIFFQVEIFAIKSKWIYSKIPPEIYLEKFHLEKNNPAGIYTNHWVTHPTTNHDLVA